jgi:hypothetical protein
MCGILNFSARAASSQEPEYASYHRICFHFYVVHLRCAVDKH